MYGPVFEGKGENKKPVNLKHQNKLSKKYLNILRCITIQKECTPP